MGKVFTRVEVPVRDGWYSGLWSGHTLKWDYEGVMVQCETDRGIRGVNVLVGFEVREGEVVENTMRPVGSN